METVKKKIVTFRFELFSILATATKENDWPSILQHDQILAPQPPQLLFYLSGSGLLLVTTYPLSSMVIIQLLKL